MTALDTVRLGFLSSSIRDEMIHRNYNCPTDAAKIGTWNALGRCLTDKRILDALDKLAEKQVKISSLIIDDNWQSIDHNDQGKFQQQGWVEFEAEQESFPEGLQQTVRRIRHQHPHIQHVAVWHALLGEKATSLHGG